MTTVAYPNRFVRRVREEMTAQDLSIRGLARKMDPANLNRARRNLHRWLDEGTMPSRASRAEVAVALGIHEEELADDDEEADPVAAFTQALTNLVRKAIAEQVPARANAGRAA